MVLAHHLIWVAYGWWLPNDLRGSTSNFIGSDVIAQLGDLHQGRKRLQPASKDIRRFYEKAADVLKFSLLRFTPMEMNVLAQAFAEVISWEKYTCYACAIMPDHIHMVIRKHRDLAEAMIAKLQQASRDAVLKIGDTARRELKHPVWGGPGWKVFLDAPQEITRTIEYVEDNPIKLRMPRQTWDFVQPYDGWPFHKRG
jgi:REP element-mobilizing transposase RayT